MQNKAFICLAGFYVMTDDWFGEYMFQIVVDRKFVPEEVANVHKQDPIVLPVWDEGKFWYRGRFRETYCEENGDVICFYVMIWSRISGV